MHPFWQILHDILTRRHGAYAPVSRVLSARLTGSPADRPAGRSLEHRLPFRVYQGRRANPFHNVVNDGSFRC